MYLILQADQAQSETQNAPINGANENIQEVKPVSPSSNLFKY